MPVHSSKESPSFFLSTSLLTPPIKLPKKGFARVSISILQFPICTPCPWHGLETVVSLPAAEWQRCYYITSGEWNDPCRAHVEFMPSTYFISSQTSSPSVYGTLQNIYTDGSGSPMTWEFIHEFQQLASQLLPPHILCVCVCVCVLVIYMNVGGDELGADPNHLYRQ